MNEPHPNTHPDTISRAPRMDLVAPGVHRLYDGMVNVYLVEEPDGLVLVDAGLPGLHPHLLTGLASIGRRLADITAVLITHSHPDHTGLAERLRVEAGARVWVHEADAGLLRDPSHTKRYFTPERSFAGYLLRRPATLRVPVHIARNGGFRPRPVKDPTTFTGGQVLDAPGHPTAIAVPGHTTGSSAFHFPDRGLLFTGDALVTRDDITGRDGPRIIAGAFTQDSGLALASLTALSDLPAALLLPGHGGALPGELATAVARAREAGPS